MRRALLTLAIASASALLVLAPFTLGYIAGHGDGVQPARTFIESWLGRVHLVQEEPRRAPVPAPSEELDALFQPFWEAWGYVNRDFYGEDTVDAKKLSRGAIRGMLGSLGDSHTLYLDPVHREMTEADLRGAFDGIGVQVEMVEERLLIVSPLEGSPGERAGLRPGDVISHVDGHEIKGVNLVEAIGLIRGPRGSSVTLTIRRQGREPFDVTVPREEIQVPAVRGELRSDGVGYVRITNFSAKVDLDLLQLLDRLGQSPSGQPHGWVLDLRGNPGGYLDAAVAVASQFLEDAVVLYEERRGGERQEIRSQGRGPTTSGPMAVLVDGGTASAAEIVAGALQDHGRATVIGERTYGKGTVQVIHRLSDGSALRLTVARWLTPRGNPIQGLGLSPQVPVEAIAGADAALDRALAFIRQEPGHAALPATNGMSQAPGPRSQAPEEQTWDLRPETWDMVGILDSAERTGRPGLV